MTITPKEFAEMAERVIEDDASRRRVFVDRYRATVQVAADALRSGHLPTLWAALSDAADLEIANHVVADFCAGDAYDNLGIPDCYERPLLPTLPPCGARKDDPASYCRTTCPLKGY